MPLFLLLVAVPIIEIALFIKVGGLIGLWPTIAIVLGTAALGSWLLRSQGAGAMAELQRSLAGGGDPGKALAHGAMILVSGILLLTPGFFTDAVGFALLSPGVRNWAMGFFGRRMKGHVHVAGMGMRGEWRSSGPAERPQGPRNPAHDPGEGVIDAEVIEDRPRDPNAPPSGWTRPPE